MIFGIPETPSGRRRGASLRQLMDRMGHNSMRAALICTDLTRGSKRSLMQ